MKKIASHIIDSVGDTPLVRLHKMFDGFRPVYAKMEGLNPAGSMKDRTASLIVSELIREGKIAPGGTIIESSSGNMAVGLAQACLFYGLKLKVVVDPYLNPHTHKLLQAYGAELIKVGKPDIKGGFLAARLNKVNELLDAVPNSVWSDQYSNPNNPKAYHATMSEIMSTLDHKVDYLFVASSTCGSLMGCADYIEKHRLKTKMIAVDAVGSVLFGGPVKSRKIPGHGSGMPSNFLELDKVHDVIHVTDLDCVDGCNELLQHEAILAGGSSGGIVSAYSKYQHNLPEGSVSVLLFADRGERYLDTIYNPDWVRHNVARCRIPKDSFKELMVENHFLIPEHGIA